MPRYDTDSEISFTFSHTFFATSLAEAEAISVAFVNRVFGSAINGTIDRLSNSNVALVGQDITGSNYTFNYEYNWRQGDKDNAVPIYNTLFAATVADGLSQLQSTAQRVTNVSSFPLKVNYFKVAP